jgi:cytochrome c oxidase assembly protein subunit 15
MGLVNESESLARVVVMPLHLVNTAFLLGSTVMTAEALKHGHIPRIALPRGTRQLLGILVTTLLVILTTGAVAALGSHLAPSGSLLSGFSKDLSSESHLAVRLRILHPALALIGGLAIWTILQRLREEAPSARSSKLVEQLMLALGAAVVIGICTLLTLTPTWLKITHLLMANVIVVMTSRCAFHTLRPSSLDKS